MELLQKKENAAANATAQEQHHTSGREISTVNQRTKSIPTAQLLQSVSCSEPLRND